MGAARCQCRRRHPPSVLTTPLLPSPHTRSAIVAVVATNVVIAAYIVNAFLEKPDPAVGRTSSRGGGGGGKKAQ